MKCKQVELEMPEGHTKDVTVCKTGLLPSYIKGLTNKTDLVLINKYLGDLRELGISHPELYVDIHELNHIKFPEESEYEIRVRSDKEYKEVTGEKINTSVGFLGYTNYVKRLEREFN